MTEDDVLVVALAILCDLAAWTRPRRVTVNRRYGIPAYGRTFRSSLRALLSEQDVEWKRAGWTSIPKLEGRLSQPKQMTTITNPRRVVLGFSGGKDSIVALHSLIAGGYDVIPVLLNEGARDWQDIRRWIPKLKRMKLRPLDAYLSTRPMRALAERFGDCHLSSYQIGWLGAFLATCARRLNASTIALGIESSADQSYDRYRDRRINHQHQKTTRHLFELEAFYRRSLCTSLRVASPIAELTDAQVLQVLLSQVPASRRRFSSCGAANWQSKHCGECEKCAFVFALLSTTHAGRGLIRQIFRSDLFEDVDLYRPWMDGRYRSPLACIGPRTEVWSALEERLRAGDQRPTIQTWRDCSNRQRWLASPDNGTRLLKPSVLTEPVPAAASILRKWLGDSR